MNNPSNNKTWKNYLLKVLIPFLTLLIGSGAMHQYKDIQLREADQIISIRSRLDPIVVESLKLIEEYRLILGKYPDALFQDTEDTEFVDTKDTEFIIKISKENEEKLKILAMRLDLLKESFQAYEDQLAKLEDRVPRNINEIVPLDLN